MKKQVGVIHQPFLFLATVCPALRGMVLISQKEFFAEGNYNLFLIVLIRVISVIRG
jgi:hypothetical protein